MDNVSTRFWAKVDKTETCWLWTAFKDSDGYGRFTSHYRSRSQPAHRFAYEATHGPVPAGLVLDHLCRVHNCVRPGHLEPVTQTENVLRGIGPTAVNARKTHCNSGHEFDTTNTYVYEGDLHRRCRTCHLERCRAYRARKRAERQAA